MQSFSDKTRSGKYHFLAGTGATAFAASLGFAFYEHLWIAIPFMLIAVASATVMDRYEFRSELENKR